MPAEEKVVARFKPPAPFLGKPAGLAVKRGKKKSTLLVSWKKVKEATTYSVSVALADGTIITKRTKASKLTLTRILKSDSGRVAVVALAPMRNGKTAVKSFKRAEKAEDEVRRPQGLQRQEEEGALPLSRRRELSGGVDVDVGVRELGGVAHAPDGGDRRQAQLPGGGDVRAAIADERRARRVGVAERRERACDGDVLRLLGVGQRGALDRHEAVRDARAPPSAGAPSAPGLSVAIAIGSAVDASSSRTPS